MTRSLKLFTGIVIVVAVASAVISVWNDAAIIDEDPHIGAGYSYLAAHDMRLNPEHPPLAKDLAAIPLLFMGLNDSAFSTKAWLTDLNGQWEFGRSVMFNSGVDAQAITRAAKMPMFLFFILSAILLSKWAYEQYGRWGVMLGLPVFAFSPTVMAHSRFVTTDVAALFAILFSTYFFVKFLKASTRKNGLIAALVFGIALLAKFSTFLLIPSLGLTAIVWGLAQSGDFKKRLTTAVRFGFYTVLIFAVGFIVLVWPVYYFHTYSYPPERQRSDTETLLSSFGKRYLVNPVIWASDKPVLRAAGQYGLGVLMVTQRAAGGNTIYFLGEVAKSGGKKYFPVVYFIKEPLAWWGLVVIALIGFVIRTRKPIFGMTSFGQWLRGHLDEVAMLIWLAIYWFMSVRSPLNIGVRHLLPTYPFAILLVVGGAIRFGQWIKDTGRRGVKIYIAAICVLMGWYLFENLNTWPYYLTYFNQTVGGPSGGYRYVVDSNLDWGQDLKRFADWVIANDVKQIEFDYFGWADPDYYMPGRRQWLSSTEYKDAADFLARNTTDGWIAVSASFLQGTIGSKESPETVNYLWLKKYKPVIVIGNSIWVWHITK